MPTEPAAAPEPTATPPDRCQTRAQREMAQRHARREARFDEIRALFAADQSLRAIARQLGIGRDTVRRMARAATCPQYRPRAPRPGILDAHEPHLRDRWAAGEQNAAQLWRELRARGFPGSAGCGAPLEQTGEIVHDVATLDRELLQPDTLGLTLAEAKALPQGVQQAMVNRQIAESARQHASCPACGLPLAHKGTRTIVVRSLFGTLRLRSPRLFHCPCQPQSTRTFSPLAMVLPERTTPELRYPEARFASLMPYGLTARLLDEVLPLGRPVHATTIRNHAHAVARRLDGEIGEERPMCIDGCQRDWDALPRPDLPLTVSLDRGYVHARQQTSRTLGLAERGGHRGPPEREETGEGGGGVPDLHRE